MITLLIATRNDHKVAEIQTILWNEFRFLTLNDFSDVPEVIEDAATFSGNASKKASELARWLTRAKKFRPSGPLFVLADDSGLEVDALRGAPGVYSARFSALDTGSAGNSSAAENNAKLLRFLEGVPCANRTARFRCVVALTPVTEPQPEDASPVCYADEFEMMTELFDGACEGHIGCSPQGSGGFGYDPLFFPAGFEQTFGELPSEVKNRLSHRGMALEKLKKRFRSKPDSGP